LHQKFSIFKGNKNYKICLLFTVALMYLFTKMLKSKVQTAFALKNSKLVN